MVKLLQSICRFLEEGEDLVLTTIIDQGGSAPRSVGAKMAVRPNGAVIGTIGGGMVEYRAQELAAKVRETGEALTETVEFFGEDAAVTDRMICGGRVEILLELLTSSPENLREIKELAGAMQKTRRGFLIKTLEMGGNGKGRMAWCLTQENGVALGAFPCSDILLAGLTDGAARAKRPLALAIEGTRFFVEPTVPPGTVYLFGAGHVARSVADLAEMVGFRTVVIDDRPEYASAERFPKANQLKVAPSFQESFSGLEIDRESYLVILTRGHLHDRVVLEQALTTEAGYIGMISSRRKRDLIYQELLTKGFRQEELERVHAPIGLAIGAETPEEIAVSIVAELIQVRAKGSA